ncbi:MAG: hypothetical protein AAGC93_08610 [Cyanobacteria bacterium P01_F01_bin.53]
MNLNPDSYNDDLPGLDGTAALSANNGLFRLTDDDKTALVESLEGTDGRQTLVIALVVVGGVGLTILALNLFVGRFFDRIDGRDVPDPPAPGMTDTHPDENQDLGRHKTTAALAQQQSQLAQFDSKTATAEREETTADASEPETPRFSPRKGSERPTPPAPVYPAQPVWSSQQPTTITPPPRLTRSERLPTPSLTIDPPITPPEIPYAGPNQPSTPPVVDDKEAQPSDIESAPAQTAPRVSAALPMVYQTHRIPARLKDAVTLTESLLAFGVSVPLILDAPLPTLSHKIPAHSECLADVVPDRGSDALTMTVTACLSQGQIYPVAEDNMMVLSSDLTPVTVDHVGVADRGREANADDALRETFEHAALEGAQGLVRDILGDDLLGDLAGSALETLTESVTADTATPEGSTSAAEPRYTLPVGMPLVVVSRAPVVVDSPLPIIEPPTVAPEVVIPAVIESIPDSAPPPTTLAPDEPEPSIHRPVPVSPVEAVPDETLPAPHRDFIDDPPVAPPVGESNPRSAPLPPAPRFHQDGQRMRTLEELLTPLQAMHQ